MLHSRHEPLIDTDDDTYHPITFANDSNDPIKRSASRPLLDNRSINDAFHQTINQTIKQSTRTQTICTICLLLAVFTLGFLTAASTYANYQPLLQSSNQLVPTPFESNSQSINQPSLIASAAPVKASPQIFMSISPIRLNETIVIHGVDLDQLYDQSKSAKLFINDVDCSIVSSSTSHFECQVSQINQITTNEMSTAHISFQFSNQIINQSLPLLRTFTHWEKNNIALVIHFNKHDRLIDRSYLLAPYYRLFPRVFLVSPEKGPLVDLACKQGQNGIAPYVCLGEISALYPGYNGYLQLHFDCLVDFVRLENFPVDQFWAPKIDSIGNKNQGHIQKVNGTWHWPEIRDGVEGVYYEIDQVINQTHPNLNSMSLSYDQSINQVSIYQSYKNNYINNVGSWDNWLQSFADVFYLPSRYVDDWQRLTLSGRLFERHSTYVEVAYAILVNLIVDRNQTINQSNNQSNNQAVKQSKHFQMIHGLWNYDVQPIIHSFFDSIDRPYSNETLIYFHQIQLNLPICRDMIRRVVDRALPR